MNERFFTGGQIAEILCVSRSHVYKLLREGKLPGIRLGRSVRIRQSDLIAFIEGNITGKSNDQDKRFQE
jgi:excisionase family DNA binding protein